MTEEELILWGKLEAFEIDDPDSDYTFSMRLSRENGWTIDYTLRTIDEYKKFIFMAAQSKHQLFDMFRRACRRVGV